MGVTRDSSSFYENILVPLDASLHYN